MHQSGEATLCQPDDVMISRQEEEEEEEEEEEGRKKTKTARKTNFRNLLPLSVASPGCCDAFVIVVSSYDAHTQPDVMISSSRRTRRPSNNIVRHLGLSVTSPSLGCPGSCVVFTDTA